MTTEFEQQVSANHSEEAIFFLMTISSAELNQDIYCVNNNEPITSRGQVYEAFPFEVLLPPDDGGAPKDLKIRTYNLSEEFMDMVRQTTEPPQVKLELISTRDPDVVEKTIDFMALGGAEYDKLEITFSLIANTFAARKTLQNKYAQNEFPGLFFALQ